MNDKTKASLKGNNKKKTIGLNYKLIVSLIVLLALFIVFCVVVFVNPQQEKTVNPETKSESTDIVRTGDLKSVYRLDEVTIYEFDSEGRGILYTDVNSYGFSYIIDKDKVILDFDDERATDKTYTFSLNGDVLTLKGGTQTYNLKREIKE